MNTLDLRSVCLPFFNVVEKVSKATLESFIAKLDGQQARPIVQTDTRHGRCWNRKHVKSVTNAAKRPRNYPSNLLANEPEKRFSFSREKLKLGRVPRPEEFSQASLKECPMSTGTKSKTRAWVAWNQLQSTKLGRARKGVGCTGHGLDRAYSEKLRITGMANDLGSNTLSSQHWLESDKYRNPFPGSFGHVKVNNARKVLESSTSSGEAYPRDATKSSIPLQALNERLSRNASNTTSQREAAIRAIEQVLAPSLVPSREGRGDLELQLAGYLTALNSSALTNEADHCEKEVHARLASMKQSIDRSNHDRKSMDSWLDVAEMRLRSIPTHCDVLHLQGLLEHSSSEGTYPAPVKERMEDSWISNSQLISNRPNTSERELLQYIKQKVLQMESSLAQVPNVCDIQRMRPRSLHMEMEMSRHEESTREAVRKLRHAVSKGEVAWVRNLELSTCRLESLAGVLVPLEATYKGSPAPARV